MDSVKLEKAKKYKKINLTLSISSTILSIVIFLLFVILGYSVELRELVNGWFENAYMRLVAFLFVIGAAYSVVSFPLSFFGDFWLEHHFELSNQSFWAWMWEKTKGFLVGLVLGVPLLLIFYFFLL